MRILHVIPGDNFTEGMGYKDNYLAAINAQDGHDVLILSSCNMWKDSNIVYAEPCDRIMEDGVRLIRRKYKKYFNDLVSSKLRILDGAGAIIEDFQPDVIRVLNPHNFTLPIVIQYKKKNPRTKLYVDSHQEYYNSGTGFLSYWVFHRFLISRMLQSSLSHIDKIFYCLEGTKVFLREMYDIPEEKMEVYPMGGLIREDNERQTIREKTRKALNIEKHEIMMVHSGKLSEGKRTKELLEAMAEVNNPSFRLILIGSIPEDMKPVLNPLIEEDNRVVFLGWKTADELEQYIIAADLYLQPGTASATVYKPLCAGTALVVAPDIKGYDAFMKSVGWYANTKQDLVAVFQEIQREPTVLIEMGKNALEVAREMFDYRKLAARLYR